MGVERKVRGRRGLSLIEGLVASVVLSLTAAGAGVGLAVGLDAQREASLQMLAGLAAEQQVSTMLVCDYDSVSGYAGSEAVGAMLTPPRKNSSGQDVRDPMGTAYSKLGRTTAAVAETRTFSQYNNFSVPGWKITVTVTDAAGRVYARIERFRPKEIAQ